jgi:hypothetical protein
MVNIVIHDAFSLNLVLIFLKDFPVAHFKHVFPGFIALSHCCIAGEKEENASQLMIHSFVEFQQSLAQ